jgi:hypothetical protein
MTEAPTHPPVAFERTASFVGRLPELRLTRHQSGVGLILVVALAYYYWTAETSMPVVFSRQATDVYNLLTTGFLHGHVSLPITPIPAFLHLKNPYNAAERGGSYGAYGDLIWYHGHFYSAWGPAAALLFIVFRLLTLGHLMMSQTFAVIVYSWVGLVCAVGTLHLLVRRLIPRTPNWVLIAGTLALALSNIAPFLLRRPAQYEVAISGALALEMAGLWLVCSATLSERRRRSKLAVGSLLLGLAVAARPTMGVGVLVLVAGACHLIKQGGVRRAVLAQCFVPFLVCCTLLGAYNVARFGSPGNFGNKYQLAAYTVIDKPVESLSYVPPGLFGYLLIPPRLQVGFPYVSLLTDTEYPWRLPAGYTGGSGGWPAEPTGGLLPTIPITLMLFSLPWLIWRRRGTERVAAMVASGLSIVGLAIVFLLAYALWGTTQRYEMDYASYFLIASVLVWALWLTGAGTRRWARRGVATAGVVLTGVGALIGTATGITGYYNLLDATHPHLFKELTDAFAPLPTLVTEIAGHPMIAEIDDSSVDYPAYGPLDLQDDGATLSVTSVPATFTIISPSSQRYFLDGTVDIISGSRARVMVLVDGRPYLLRVVPDRTLHVPLDLRQGINRVTISLDGRAAPTPTPFSLTDVNLERR